MGRLTRKPAADVAFGEAPESTEGLFAEIRRLTEANRRQADRERERRLLRLRHLAGIRLLRRAEPPPYPAPDVARLPQADDLPAISPADLTPGLLRAGILRHGCVLVRGLLGRADAVEFATEIDRAFAEREAVEEGESASLGYYEEFASEPPFEAPRFLRPFVKEFGGMLAADSPKLACRLLELLDGADVPHLVEDYLGEPPLLSIQKTTLRRIDPSAGGSWHQDGSFMGGARALNLWVSLSRCGDEAPGLDLVPRRLDEIVIQHGEMLDAQLTSARAYEAAGDQAILRPIFEPGDALFFDEMLVHKTGADLSMPNQRYAIESWFFGGSAFPDNYAPLAV